MIAKKAVARLSLALVLAGLPFPGRAGGARSENAVKRPAFQEALALIKSPHWGLDALWARTAIKPETPHEAESLKAALALLSKPEASAPLRAELVQAVGEREAAAFESAAANLPLGVREQLSLIASRLGQTGDSRASGFLEEVYSGGRHPVFTIERRDGAIPLSEIQDVVRVIFDVNAMAAGSLEGPARAHLRLSRFSKRFFVDPHGNVTVGRRGSEEAEDGQFRAKAAIAHEWGHVLFTHNFRLAGGERLGAKIAGMERRQQKSSRRLAAVEGRAGPVSSFYRALKKSGKEDEAGKLSPLRERLMRRKEAAYKEFFQTIKNRNAFIEPIRAYNELFADCVGILLTGDPRAIVEHLRFVKAQSPREQYLPYIEQRDFSREPKVRLYDFAPDDDYTLLNHARHHLWRHYFSAPAYRDKKGVLLAVLLKAMNQEGNAKLRDESSFPSGYKEINERLIRRFDSLMGEKHAAQVRLEKAASAFAGKL